MKKYLILALLITIMLTLVSCGDKANTELISDNTSDTTTLAPAPESNTETTVSDTTVTEPDVTEPETTEITEPIVTELDTSEAVTEPNPNEALLGTFVCDSEVFKDDAFAKAPEYIPALTLKDDGSMIWRVYYVGGVVDIEGTYVIEENKIYIDCVLEGTPVHGIDVGGFPYMDNKFVFEIEDNNTLVYYNHPDAKLDYCYAVYPGDKLVRE